MAKMCPLDGCSAKSGLCIHDTMIIGGGILLNQRRESWGAHIRCTAYVEAWQIGFPALTYGQQLKEAQLTVVRPSDGDDGTILEDRVAAAASTDLFPSDRGTTCGESTLIQLVQSDPAFQCMRSLIGQFPLQMEQLTESGEYRALMPA